MKNKIFRLREVQEKTGLKRSTIYQMILEGRFPKQVRLGLRSVGWHSDHIQEWLDSRKPVA